MTDVATMQAHCLAKPGAWADKPWDHEHPVVEVGPLLGAVDESYRFVAAKLPEDYRPEGRDT